MDEPRILVTNDDGIESPGFRALYEALSAVGDVVAVAPYADQSAVGRAMSDDVVVHEYDLGYAIEGTPADCVVAGLESLAPDADLVVSGCNEGANLGQYVLGRSGTVSAAVEAAFFDVPALAVSMYVPEDEWGEGTTDREDYAVACDAASYLARDAVETMQAGRDADHRTAAFGPADYLNVNAPMASHVSDPEAVEMTVTEPSELYDMGAAHEDGVVQLTDRVWRRMKDGDIPDPEGTDRRALVDGKVSVSPLTAPHTVTEIKHLDDLAATY
ncbi:MAG: 5'/3'-nucleotidase SurE [Halolamina sp.]